jgi:hypothetical protein
LEDAVLLELLDVTAAGGAVLCETLRILRESFEKIRQFLDVTGRNIYAKLSFG